MTPAPMSAEELAAWLDSYADDQDQVCMIISGSDDVPPALRAAASRLRSIAALEAERDAAYARGLEDAAKVADETASRWLERCWVTDGASGRPRAKSETAAALAAAIRALAQKGE